VTREKDEMGGACNTDDKVSNA